MSTAECSSDVGIGGSAAGLSPQGRPLHRLREVRHQQGVSLRRVARQMRRDIRDLKQQEEATADLKLSELYAWQKALEVPVNELLVENNGPLSPPVLERARLVKLMKTAAAIQEKAETPSIRRMAETLVGQLLEIMPELQGVSAWHAVGQRRTLDEFGRAVERGMSVPYWTES